MLQLFLEGFLKGREAMRSAVFFPLRISSKCLYESSPGLSLPPHEKVLAKHNSDVFSVLKLNKFPPKLNLTGRFGKAHEDIST